MIFNCHRHRFTSNATFDFPIPIRNSISLWFWSRLGEEQEEWKRCKWKVTQTNVHCLLSWRKEFQFSFLFIHVIFVFFVFCISFLFWKACSGFLLPPFLLFQWFFFLSFFPNASPRIIWFVCMRNGFSMSKFALSKMQVIVTRMHLKLMLMTFELGKNSASLFMASLLRWS